jgi:hypothetical protein
MWRLLVSTLVAGVVVAAAGFGYWFGVSRVDLDSRYLAALEDKQKANAERLTALTRELADARLTQSVDAEAARSLRDTISGLRDQLGSLREEVTFYKRLMAPSSIERGLKIAELELAAGEKGNQFSYHILLTQAEERRDWVQGVVSVEFVGQGTAPDGAALEVVLPLTDLAEVADYPFPYRFRYFQNLSGVVTLPDGFRPRLVRVLAKPKGAAERIERSFDWTVQPG